MNRALKLLDNNPDLLRERAKEFMKRREWDRALNFLDKTLKKPTRFSDTEEEKPDKQSLTMRSRIRLVLCDNEGALADALEALKDLSHTDPIYGKALALQADALFQMGKFEHSLVIYHRGSRLRGGADDEFRLGIQKATESINNCLKHVKKKIKVDISVEDTSSSSIVSKTSFVFPQTSCDFSLITQLGNSNDITSEKTSRFRRQKKSKTTATFCMPPTNPFKEDIAEFQKIVQCLEKQKQLPSKMSEIRAYSNRTLLYLKSRKEMWKSQSVKSNSSSNNVIFEFDANNLSEFYGDEEAKEEEDKKTREGLKASKAVNPPLL